MARYCRKEETVTYDLMVQTGAGTPGRLLEQAGDGMAPESLTETAQSALGAGYCSKT